MYEIINKQFFRWFSLPFTIVMIIYSCCLFITVKSTLAKWKKNTNKKSQTNPCKNIASSCCWWCKWALNMSSLLIALNSNRLDKCAFIFGCSVRKSFIGNPTYRLDVWHYSVWVIFPSWSREPQLNASKKCAPYKRPSIYYEWIKNEGDTSCFYSYRKGEREWKSARSEIKGCQRLLCIKFWIRDAHTHKHTKWDDRWECDAIQRGTRDRREEKCKKKVIRIAKHHTHMFILRRCHNRIISLCTFVIFQHKCYALIATCSSYIHETSISMCKVRQHEHSANL